MRVGTCKARHAIRSEFDGDPGYWRLDLGGIMEAVTIELPQI